jgi:hypothetical protein
MANNLKLISTIHTAKFVETKKKNRKAETVKKPEITGGYNKFM